MFKILFKDCLVSISQECSESVPNLTPQKSVSALLLTSTSTPKVGIKKLYDCRLNFNSAIFFVFYFVKV